MDISQAHHLLTRLSSEVIPPRVIQAFLATAWLRSEFGTITDDGGSTETYNWLGAVVPDQPEMGLQTPDGWFLAYGNPADGIGTFVATLVRSVGTETLLSGDAGRLAWAMLVSNFVHAPKSIEVWKALRGQMLAVCSDVARQLGQGSAWSLGEFHPPIQAPEVWTHKSAARALDLVLPRNVSSQDQFGLLLWASYVSHYGHVNGVQTHNWGMLGQRVLFGTIEPPEGHVLDESGQYAVRVFASFDEGLTAYLDHMSKKKTPFEQYDFGRLSERILRDKAMGIDIPFNQDTWHTMTVDLRQMADQIARDTGIPNHWQHKYVPADLVEKKEKAEQKVEREGRKIPWGKVAIGGAVLTGLGIVVRSWWKDDPTRAQAAPDTQIVKD